LVNHRHYSMMMWLVELLLVSIVGMKNRMTWFWIILKHDLCRGVLGWFVVWILLKINDVDEESKWNARRKERKKNWPLTVFERRRAGWEMLWEGSQKAFEIDWRGSTPLTTRANMCVCICATYSFSLFFFSLRFFSHTQTNTKETSCLRIENNHFLSLSLSWKIFFLFYIPTFSIGLKRNRFLLVDDRRRKKKKNLWCLSKIVKSTVTEIFYTLVTISILIDWLLLRLIWSIYLSWIVK
jgi:hypothetical protein